MGKYLEEFYYEKIFRRILSMGKYLEEFYP
jgi:hypothetical protein